MKIADADVYNITLYDTIISGLPILAMQSTFSIQNRPLPHHRCFHNQFWSSAGIPFLGEFQSAKASYDALISCVDWTGKPQTHVAAKEGPENSDLTVTGLYAPVHTPVICNSTCGHQGMIHTHDGCQ